MNSNNKQPGKDFILITINLKNTIELHIKIKWGEKIVLG